MKPRLFILLSAVTFLLAVLLFAAWFQSYRHEIYYDFAWTRLLCTRGQFHYSWYRAGLYESPDLRWQNLGFAFENGPIVKIRIPLWFPTLLFAAASYLAFSRYRSLRHLPGGFPAVQRDTSMATKEHTITTPPLSTTAAPNTARP